MERTPRGNEAQHQATLIPEESPARIEGNYAREKLKTDLKRLASRRVARMKKSVTA